MSDLRVGDTVKISAPNHRQDGKTGVIVSFGKCWGTVGVEIGGHRFGFLPIELTKENPDE